MSFSRFESAGNWLTWLCLGLVEGFSNTGLLIELYGIPVGLSCRHKKLSGYSMNNNGTELEQVVHTHDIVPERLAERIW